MEEIVESSEIPSLCRRRCLNALSVIEEFIPADDFKAFQTTFDEHKEWDGAVRCQALFEVWSKLKDEVNEPSDEVLE
jgi:hypothetical protein